MVAAGRDIVVFHSLEHSTTRLVSVSTVVEAAMLREMEYLFEIARYLFRLHIEGAKTFYARSVDDVATTWQLEHFAECCGVHTRIVSIANLGSTLLSARHNAIDKRVDFPTPLFPLSKVTLPCKCGIIVSTPSPVSADTSKHS